MKVDDHICLHCGSCVGACPENAVVLIAASSIRFLSSCTTCGRCVKVCPVGAIQPSLPTSQGDMPACAQQEDQV